MNLSTEIRPKRCRVCPAMFTPVRPMQIVCGLACARRIPVAARKQAKAERKATRARLDEMKPLSHWVKVAQRSFNGWIKERDRLQPCISCGKAEGSAWNTQDFHAGHFVSTGAAPELRFDEANCHKQCAACNTHLHGNLVRYRANLIERIGQVEVDRLEGPHEPKRYRAEDLKAITADYRARLKALQKATA